MGAQKEGYLWTNDDGMRLSCERRVYGEENRNDKVQVFLRAQATY